MSRLVVLMRIPEGQAGSVSAYVVARAAPRTSAAVTYPVHTLCMHHRVHTPDSGRTYGHVDVSGDFRTQEMHAWVANVLPDMPRQSADEETRLAYRSSALNTHVIASFRNGTARFASDSAAALAMLRAELTRCEARMAAACLRACVTCRLGAARWTGMRSVRMPAYSLPERLTMASDLHLLTESGPMRAR